MFGKKNCKKCYEKINSKYNFCPKCGIQIKKYNEDDWGMLGKNDFIEEKDFNNNFLDGFSEKMINSMIGSVMKMLEKEMKNIQEKQPKTNFKLMINGKEFVFDKKNTVEKKEPSMKRMEFEEGKLKDFIKLPKMEPKTNLKRIGDKIIYEIEIPEVKSMNNIIINKLENSIEIKALGKKKAYVKIIPVSLPVLNQKLFEGKLILELNGN